MQKIVTQSPWGAFLELRFGGMRFERSAIGNFWTYGDRDLGFMSCMLLTVMAGLLPVTRVDPDTVSQMLRETMPADKLRWMDDASHS